MDAGPRRMGFGRARTRRLEAAGHLPDADADYLRYQLEELSHIDFEDSGCVTSTNGWTP